jgi:moderate conductance mechanosensitive channel
VLKQIGAGLRRDPDFQASMLDDFALWGVDKVDGGAAAMLGQMKCLDTGRWGVQWEFNRRIKMRFQDMRIRIAASAHTIFLARRRSGRRSPHPLPVAAEHNSSAETESPPPSALGNTQ